MPGSHLLGRGVEQEPQGERRGDECARNHQKNPVPDQRREIYPASEAFMDVLHPALASKEVISDNAQLPSRPGVSGRKG